MDEYIVKEGMLVGPEDLEKYWVEWLDLKPFPNEHAARLKAPGAYKRFRRENNKFKPGIHAIWGIRKDNSKVELQAIRFDKKKFTVAQAKKWLKDHDYKPILFEPASEGAGADEDLGEAEMPRLDELCVKNFALSIKDEDIEENGVFNGYGSIFGLTDLQNDIVMQGAFAKSLKRHARDKTSVKMLWQHDWHSPVGTWPEISEDAKGLKVQGKLALEVQQGKEAYVLLKAKALDGLSIGFSLKKYERDNETNIRKLLEIDLWELSLVTFPANPKARIRGVKSIRDLEGTLRDAGFSKREAKAIASHGYKGLTERDAPDMGALNAMADAVKAIRELRESLKD